MIIVIGIAAYSYLDSQALRNARGATGSRPPAPLWFNSPPCSSSACSGLPRGASIACCVPRDQLISDLELTREREARGSAALATTLRSIGDAVIATDTQGRIHFMNPIAEALTGWTNAAAEGRPLPEVFRVEDELSRQPVPDLTAKVLRDGVVVGLANHTILIARDGGRIPIDDSAAPIHDEQGNITGVVLVFRDVTLRRRAQRQLEESESRYRLLFEANPQPMWVFDRASLAFLAVNQAAIARYGYTREEFLGMTLRDIRPPEDVPASSNTPGLPHAHPTPTAPGGTARKMAPSWSSKLPRIPSSSAMPPLPW